MSDVRGMTLDDLMFQLTNKADREDRKAEIRRRFAELEAKVQMLEEYEQKVKEIAK